MSSVVQTFLDFHSFDFCNFQFTAVHNSILFSSPLVLLKVISIYAVFASAFFLCPHINNINQGMPVFIYSLNLYPSQDKEYNFTHIVFTEDHIHWCYSTFHLEFLHVLVTFVWFILFFVFGLLIKMTKNEKISCTVFAWKWQLILVTLSLKTDEIRKTKDEMKQTILTQILL